MRKTSLNYRYMVKHVLIALMCTFAYVYFISNKEKYSIQIICDAFFLVGIVYLLIGLFRLVRRMHCYDLLIYGVKKTVELITKNNYSKANSKVGEYLDYSDDYDKLFVEFIVIGVLFNIISIVLVVVN